MLHVDLFSGIGGFALGLERAGFKTIAFCEIDPYCQAVLRKHWPEVPIFKDVRSLTSGSLRNRIYDVNGGSSNEGRARCPEIVTGGFPCQDISIAGKGAGIDGERSGLWREFARLIGELRPRYAIVENTAALTFRGLLRVLGDLTEIGYDAEWETIPTGFPFGHRRMRVFIVAYPVRERLPKRGNTDKDGIDEKSIFTRERFASFLTCSDPRKKWSDRPLLGRGIHRIPKRAHRIRALGNAIVPQIAEIIGKAIMEAEKTD